MPIRKQIPEISFPNRQRRGLGFEVISNFELLRDNIPTDHNPFRPHRIRFYSILFIREGEGWHFIDFKKYPYKKGSVIFISKEQVHAFRLNPKRQASFLSFTEEFLEKSSLGSSLMQQLSLYNYHLFQPVIQLDEQYFSFFSELIRRMEEEYGATEDFATEEVILSSLRILLCLSERIRKDHLETNDQSVYQEDFLTFQRLLNKNLLKNRQVQFYADQMDISTKKLNRITHQFFHKPAKSYINEQLILEMKRLLMNTALSVKEIAYHSGFEEPTNFVKFFKKHTDLTPAAFRKQF